MKCPIDGKALIQVKRYGMQVDECPECQGMWLTPLELDQLEDKKFKADYLKGSLLVFSVETTLPCPVCQTHLFEFKYRHHQLRLDQCPQQHGFWLDYTEDKRVLEIMSQRKKDAYRRVGAQTLWEKTIQNFRWYLYSKNPQSISGKQTGLPKHVAARPPAKPYEPVILPSTCPHCGGPINSMTVISDESQRYTCGYCHTYIKPTEEK